MPNWDCIEDASAKPELIWLEREKDTDEWKPLRKADCRALNERKENSILPTVGESVYIDGGRSTADPVNGVIRYNFFNGPLRQLTSATWFTREEKSSKEHVLHPISELDSQLIEDLYQRALNASRSLGEGIDKVLKEKYVLQDDSEFGAVVSRNSAGVLKMVKKPVKGWFGTSFDLQRGWGEYVVEGEEEEMALGPVKHVIFAIHGVGEAMWTKEEFKGFSLAQEMNRVRATIHKKLVGDWKKRCQAAKKKEEKEPEPPNRIEFLPIEWYDRIHSSSNALMRSLQATTLQTIPALRAIANDVVFDVLMYLTPAFCESVLDCVTTQINDLYHGFQQVHPDFVRNGGKFSLVGHSLGSVIVWDILSILKQNDKSNERKPPSGGDGTNPLFPFDFCGVSVSNSTTPATGYQAYATADEHANEAKNGYWGPSLPKPFTKSIPFVPEFSIFLGSPIGLFLTLRGAHAVFDEMRTRAVEEAEQKLNEAAEKASDGEEMQEMEEPFGSPFNLPSGSIYNIFHPSDPVAYRIEPLLLPQDANESDFPPPVYLVKQGKGVRLHVKAMQIGDGIRKSLFDKNSGLNTFFTQVTEQAVASLATEKVDGDDSPKKKPKPTLVRPKEVKFALGGKSDRVDFQLQPGVIDNEYLSAVTAHSTYFGNTDILDFILDLTEMKEEQSQETLDGVAEKESAVDIDDKESVIPIL